MKASFVNERPVWSFPEEYESEHRFSLSDHVKPDTRFGRFVRRNAILLVGLAALIIWTWATTAIAYHNGKADATEELTAQYEQEKSEAVQAVHDYYAAKSFTSGEASRNAAISAEAKHLARIGQALLNTYKSADTTAHQSTYTNAHTDCDTDSESNGNSHTKADGNPETDQGSHCNTGSGYKYAHTHSGRV